MVPFTTPCANEQASTGNPDCPGAVTSQTDPMPDIHPTAIVPSSAKIGSGVHIGPYSILEEDVEIGDGTFIDHHVTIRNGSRLGKGNRIYPYATIGGDPQDLTFDRSLVTLTVLGDDNVVREGCNIHRATKTDHPTQIGNRNYFMGNTHLAHDCVVGDRNVLTQGCVVGGHSFVGNNAFISGLVAVHQFCRVGDFAIVGGCSKITRDVIPYTMADGQPALITGLNKVGLKRAGFTEEQTRAIKNAYKVLFFQSKNVAEGIEALRELSPSAEIQNILSFIEGSKRGILSNRE